MGRVDKALLIVPEIDPAPHFLKPQDEGRLPVNRRALAST